MDHLPLIDLRAAPDEVARGIGEACRAHGFFYVVGHGIDEALGQRLEDLSRRFFALPEETKARYAMPLGGRAWRGWFPLGGELTSGRPDRKEGMYFGAELDDGASARRGRHAAARPQPLPRRRRAAGLAADGPRMDAEVTALGHASWRASPARSTCRPTTSRAATPPIR